MQEGNTPSVPLRAFRAAVAVALLVLTVLVLTALSLPSTTVLSSIGPAAAYAQEEPPDASEDEEEGGDTGGSTGDEEEEGGDYGETGACEKDKDSFNDGFARLGGVRDSGSKAPANNAWMTCSPDYYYLTYVDTRSLFGKISDLAEEPSVFVFTGLGKTMFNSFASNLFVLHAKLMALTLAVMNWAFDIDFVKTLEGPVETLNKVLGNRVYKVLLPGVWGLAIGYGAYLSIMRNRAVDGVVVVIKSAVIGCIGLLIIAKPLEVVETYDYYIDGASNFVYAIAYDVAANGVDADGKNNNTNPNDPGNRPGDEKNYFGGLSGAIWKMYVDDPWSRLQISGTDAEYAEDHMMAVLDIKNQDGRAKYLCELAESDCGAVSGGDEPEEEPEETTGGEDTGTDDEDGGEEQPGGNRPDIPDGGGSGPGGLGPGGGN